MLNCLGMIYFYLTLACKDKRKSMRRKENITIIPISIISILNDELGAFRTLECYLNLCYNHDKIHSIPTFTAGSSLPALACLGMFSTSKL